MVYKRWNGKSCYTDDQETDSDILALETTKMSINKCYTGRDIARHMPSNYTSAATSMKYECVEHGGTAYSQGKIYVRMLQ